MTAASSMRRTLTCFGWLFLACATTPLMGQRQVAFDAQGTVFVVTKEMEERTRMFGTVGFEEARLFKALDSSFVLEVTLSDSLGLRRTTRTLTALDVQALRERWRIVTQGRSMTAKPAPAPAEPLSEEGRDRMVQTITGLGIGWYGWTLPAMLGNDAGPMPFTLYLFTAAGSYFAADGLLAERSYSEGEAAAFTYFATRGIIHGYALNTLITGEYDQLRSGFPAGTLVSLVEGLSISRWVAREQIPVGRLKAIGTVGDAGLLIGLGTAYATSSADRPFFDDAGERPGPYAASVLVGNAAGLWVGTLVAGSDHFAPGDADIMEAAGYLGAAAGFTISDMSNVQDRRSQVLGAMAGLAVGGVVGGVMASSVDLTSVEGRRIGLMTSAGLLVGLGVGYAINQEAERPYYWTFATLGGCAGLAASYTGLRRAGRSTESGARLEWNPEGVLRPVVRAGRGPMAEVRPFVRLLVPF